MHRRLRGHGFYAGRWFAGKNVMRDHGDKLVDRRIDQPAAKVNSEMTAADRSFDFGANKLGCLCSHIPSEFGGAHARGTPVDLLP